MFGLKNKHPDADKLTVQVHVVGSAEVFNLAQKIWSENQRTLRSDPATGKEFLHFAYANPKCVVWLQRDAGRHQLFELVVHWENDSNNMHEVFVVLNTPQPDGDVNRAKQLLNSVLSTPSIVLSNGN
jgi:ATP-dependent Clp protease adapter protein ClpS